MKRKLKRLVFAAAITSAVGAFIFMAGVVAVADAQQESLRHAFD